MIFNSLDSNTINHSFITLATAVAEAYHSEARNEQSWQGSETSSLVAESAYARTIRNHDQQKYEVQIGNFAAVHVSSSGARFGLL